MLWSERCFGACAPMAACDQQGSLLLACSASAALAVCMAVFVAVASTVTGEALSTCSSRVPADQVYPVPIARPPDGQAEDSFEPPGSQRCFPSEYVRSLAIGVNEWIGSLQWTKVVEGGGSCAAVVTSETDAEADWEVHFGATSEAGVAAAGFVRTTICAVDAEIVPLRTTRTALCGGQLVPPDTLNACAQPSFITGGLFESYSSTTSEMVVRKRCSYSLCDSNVTVSYQGDLFPLLQVPVALSSAPLDPLVMTEWQPSSVRFRALENFNRTRHDFAPPSHGPGPNFTPLWRVLRPHNQSPTEQTPEEVVPPDADVNAKVLAAIILGVAAIATALITAVGNVVVVLITVWGQQRQWRSHHRSNPA